jgi:hypothetical protein
VETYFLIPQFLDAFAILRKAIIIFVMSACPSVRPSVRNNLASTGTIIIKLNISKKKNFFGGGGSLKKIKV